MIAGKPVVLITGSEGRRHRGAGSAFRRGLMAFIVRRDPTLSEADIRKHCRSQLTDDKRPKHIRFVEELPKTAVGKIARRELRSSHRADEPYRTEQLGMLDASMPVGIVDDIEAARPALTSLIDGKRQ